MGVEDDDGDLAVAQHAQLVRLLHQTELPLGEGDLSVALVGDPGDLDFLPAHLEDQLDRLDQLDQLDQLVADDLT